MISMEKTDPIRPRYSILITDYSENKVSSNQMGLVIPLSPDIQDRDSSSWLTHALTSTIVSGRPFVFGMAMN